MIGPGSLTYVTSKPANTGYARRVTANIEPKRHVNWPR